MNAVRWSILLAWSLACACGGTANDSQNTSSTSTCGQLCQDDVVGYAIDDTMWLLWNENLAGQPSGAQNLTVSCPLGGTAQITGTTGVASNGINTVHLTLNLQACENSNSSYSLAFTGSLAWDGSFSSTSANALTFKSSALTIEGTVTRYDMPTVSESCLVSLTDKYNKNSSTQSVWLNGEICGRAVSQ